MMNGHQRRFRLFAPVSLLFWMVLPLPLATAAFVEVEEGVRLYYEEQGSGDPILFVHGWTASSARWNAQVPYFSKNFRVITLDLRSHGNSSKPLAGNTMTQYARDLKMFIEALGLESVILVGHSMGVTVLLEYDKQFGPYKLKALGLVDMTPCRLCTEEWNSPITPEGLAQFSYSFQQDRRAWYFPYLPRIFKTPPPVDQAEAFYQGHMRTPTVVALSLVYDISYRDYTALLPKITVPTIIFAAKSGLFPKGIETGKYMHGAIPNSRLVVFENTGHMIQVEDPEWFNRELEQFLHSLK